MTKWIFLDLGSTLIDETDCVEYRIRDLLRQDNAPDRGVLLAKMEKIASAGGNAYKEAASYFKLETISWPCHLEKLYPETNLVLNALHEKYHLGLIANQVSGVETRLRDFGIYNYFKVIASSGELGISKPQQEIFLWALEQANCQAKEAIMVGDRLDNDIVPAARLGMKTVWVTQGSFTVSDPRNYHVRPSYTVPSLADILPIFL